MPSQASKPQSPSLPKRVWTALILSGFVGQVAWVVENLFFNSFLYDNIPPDPRPISWMVATLATPLAALPFLATGRQRGAQA
jgi:hypothetical protein